MHLIFMQCWQKASCNCEDDHVITFMLLHLQRSSVHLFSLNQMYSGNFAPGLLTCSSQKFSIYATLIYNSEANTWAPPKSGIRRAAIRSLIISGYFLRLKLEADSEDIIQHFRRLSRTVQNSPWQVNWIWHTKLLKWTFKSHFRLHFMSYRWPQTASRLNFDPDFHNNTAPSHFAFYFSSCINWLVALDASRQEDEVEMLLTWPVVLKPNSRGQETAKARTQTVAIITKTLFLERWVVLYKTGITTAVYLHTDRLESVKTF